MIEDIGLKYLILQEALEEISGQEPENIGLGFVRCIHCGVSASSKSRNTLRHADSCAAAIAFRALSKVQKPIDVTAKQE
jgi:hypothetical protein